MRPGRPAALAVMVIALGGSRPALGLRPFVSTDAEVAAPGELEFELGYVGFRRRAGTTAVVAPALRANLGIVRDIEVVAEFEAAHAVSSGGRPRSEVRNAAVSLKGILREGVLQGAAGPSLAVEASLLIPTARSERQPGGEVVAIASTALRGWTLHANGGPLLDPVRANPGVAWGAIVESPLVRDVRAVAELNGQGVRGSPAESSGLVGALWVLEPPPPLTTLTLDAGVRRGISRAADDWAGTAGLTVGLPW